MQEDRSFSIVTPNFNMGKYLAETIESVLANLRDGDEYFIVDGGSTDESVMLIKRYQSRLTGWISEKDKGYAHALTKGFNLCHGRYQCWVNSGDLLLRGALDAARHAFSSTGADLVVGDDLHISEKGRIIVQSRGGPPFMKQMMLYGGWTPLQDSCFWKTSLYRDVGGVNPELILAADFDFFLRAIWAAKVAYVPKVFSAFRQHEGQKSISFSELYAVEKQNCRTRFLREIHTPLYRRIIFEPIFWFLVRFRHYVGRRAHRLWFTAGMSVSGLSATSRHS